MRQFFIDLIVILFLFVDYSSSNYIQCTSHCSQITISFQQPLSFPTDCQENTNISESALICQIDYRIDYDAKQIYINFKASNDTNLFNDSQQSESLLQTIWLGFTQEFNQPNITHRSYRCNTKSDCARLFYLNTIEYLITDGQLKLNEISLKLYNQTKSLRRCTNNFKSMNRSITRCTKGLCYAHSYDKKRYCTPDITPMFFSEIEYQIPKSLGNQRELVEYKCNKDLCNGNGMIKKIQKILLDYTNWENTHHQLTQKSSTIQQTISYSLFLFSLINLRFLF